MKNWLYGQRRCNGCLCPLNQVKLHFLLGTIRHEIMTTSMGGENDENG